MSDLPITTLSYEVNEQGFGGPRHTMLNGHPVLGVESIQVSHAVEDFSEVTIVLRAVKVDVTPTVR